VFIVPLFGGTFARLRLACRIGDQVMEDKVEDIFGTLIFANQGALGIISAQLIFWCGLGRFLASGFPII
jgi:hypothetical protein